MHLPIDPMELRKEIDKMTMPQMRDKLLFQAGQVDRLYEELYERYLERVELEGKFSRLQAKDAYVVRALDHGGRKVFVTGTAEMPEGWEIVDGPLQVIWR